MRDVTSSSGVPLANGNEVRIGYFNPGFDVPAHANDLAALGGPGSNLPRPQSGRFLASPDGSLTRNRTDAAFDGRKIFLWMFDTADDSAPALDYGNVQAYGLYSSTAANWVYPAHDDLPPANQTLITSGEANQAFYGSILGSASTGRLQLALVPEPATCALATGVACLGFSIWRRRGQRSTRS